MAFEPQLDVALYSRAPTGCRSLFSVVFFSPSVCVAPKVRSLPFTQPVCVADTSRYFQ